ncbi:MAG: hypothetical protein PWQ82_286 [Thermosediminibacterales bacterium]|nr:hypothetical protein [Thermosediminibacterales bacterium]MDK2835817.1 hypothetical protein [Thermosediminibacterales bacterium]
MDWKKAKTILIIAFIFLDAFLGYNFWLNINPEADTTVVTDSQIQESCRILQEAGILIDTKLPAKVLPQPFLMVSYQKVEPSKTASSFFGELGNVKVEKTEDSVIYRRDQEQLMVMHNGIISYFNNKSETAEKQPLVTKQDAKKIADSFIKAHGGFPPNARHDRTIYYNESDSYLVEYVQEYKGKFLASSYIDVLVTPTGVKSYYSSWLKPIGYSGKSKQIISPVQALLKMIEVLEGVNKPITITGLELGYYSRYYNAEKWQAVPAWRIVVDKDEYYYINGYTGELEQ